LVKKKPLILLDSWQIIAVSLEGSKTSLMLERFPRPLKKDKYHGSSFYTSSRSQLTISNFHPDMV